MEQIQIADFMSFFIFILNLEPRTSNLELRTRGYIFLGNQGKKIGVFLLYSSQS